MSDDTQAAREALPCPFCSSTRLAVDPDHAVECFDCGAIGPGMSPEPWNTRASPSDAADLAAARALHEGKTPEAWRLLAWGNLSALRDCQKLVTERDAQVAALTAANEAMRAALLDIATTKAKTNSEANVKTIWVVAGKAATALAQSSAREASDE